MSDFNGLNPNKQFRTGLPTGKTQPTPPKAEPTAAPLTPPAAGGNAADIKSPEHLYSLYAQQSNDVQQSIKMGQMMGSFEQQYAKATQDVVDAFQEDFGFAPPKQLLDAMVDRYMNSAQVVVNEA